MALPGKAVDPYTQKCALYGNVRKAVIQRTIACTQSFPVSFLPIFQCKFTASTDFGDNNRISGDFVVNK